VLENAQVEGTGVAAYRIASWTSALSLNETIAFYQRLRDSRWQAEGAPVHGLTITTFRFADKRNVFDHVTVQVEATNPVRIAVQFVPPGTLAAATFELVPASAVAIGTLPPATAIPSLMPSWAVPANADLVDAASLGGTVFAVFNARGDVASVLQAFLDALDRAGRTASVEHSAGGSTIHVGGGPNRIVLEATPDGVRVSIAVTP
jgi:hypothetical protein